MLVVKLKRSHMCRIWEATWRSVKMHFRSRTVSSTWLSAPARTRLPHLSRAMVITCPAMERKGSWETATHLQILRVGALDSCYLCVAFHFHILPYCCLLCVIGNAFQYWQLWRTRSFMSESRNINTARECLAAIDWAALCWRGSNLVRGPDNARISYLRQDCTLIFTAKLDISSFDSLRKKPHDQALFPYIHWSLIYFQDCSKSPGCTSKSCRGLGN